MTQPKCRPSKSWCRLPISGSDTLKTSARDKISAVPGVGVAKLNWLAQSESQLSKAKKLFESGKVMVVEKSDALWRATVAGTGKKPYNVIVDDRLIGTCDCRSYINAKAPKFCKHIGAVAYAWMSELKPQSQDDIRRDEANLQLYDALRAMPSDVQLECLFEIASQDGDIRRFLIDKASTSRGPKFWGGGVTIVVDSFGEGSEG